MAIIPNRGRRVLGGSALDAWRVHILQYWSRDLSMAEIASRLERRHGLRVDPNAIQQRIRWWCTL